MKNFSAIKIVSIALLLIPFVGFSKDKKSKSDSTKAADKKSIAEIIKGSKKIAGLFELYQDTLTGAVRMVISEKQLDKEFILFSHVANGVVDADFFKGSYIKSTVFTINKYFDKIEFVEQNTSMYFDPKSPLSKSNGSNISKSVMLSEKIESTDSKDEKKYLIKCDGLFLKETLGQIKASPNPAHKGFTLGSLDKEKTKIIKLKNYPENTDVQVEYVYSQEAPSNYGSNGVTDARNVSIQIQYSLIRMPENDYQPRFDDPRVGYFTTELTDMTSASPTPYRDMINRWYLKKKDPTAALSEPEQPIVWWIENTTPLEFRDVIKEAVLQWNVAFEKAGFKNAVVVNIQPDNADWDAGDIRYNVLRWTSSPNPPFGGYGPSFVNPRTGQILGADIMLEFVYHTNRVKYSKLFNLSNAKNEEENSTEFKTKQYCTFGESMQESEMLGATMLAAQGADDMELVGMKREAMLELVMHETGHTMGLNHNMKASQMLSPAQLYDKEFIKGKPLVGSVMDYVIINLAPDKAKQGQYFTDKLGPYDLWAIEFGYKPFKDQAELNAVLEKSTQPELVFGNDADDMRSAGYGIDPRVNIDDMSSDQIKYSTDRIELVNDLMKKIKVKYSKNGQSYQELRQAYYILSSQYNLANVVMSRFIGGVYVDRAVIGQAGATKPYTPVSLIDQKRAMTALNKYAFAPDAYATPNELYNYLALQRRGYNFGGAPEDPKIHEKVLAAQQELLHQLLHKNTLQRIVDTKLYGNEYALSEYLTDLTNGIFAADLAGNVNTFRQNLQSEYVKTLITISASNDYMNTVKAMAVYLLKDIKKKQGITGDLSTQAHHEYLRTLITNALEKGK